MSKYVDLRGMSLKMTMFLPPTSSVAGLGLHEVGVCYEDNNLKYPSGPLLSRKFVTGPSQIVVEYP
jgi:hypothetical protein